MAKYLINTDNPGSYIESIGCIPPGTEITLPDSIPPRNSWLPLDDDAKECFKRRNEAVLAKAKEEGANEKELREIAKKLEPDKNRTPQMKRVDEKPERTYTETTRTPVTITEGAGRKVSGRASDSE